METTPFERERILRALQEELYRVEQTLGKALGYPWYKDDQKNFPGATEDDGVCTGEHTAATLAVEAARRISENNHRE